MCTAYFFTGEYQIDVCLLKKLAWTYKGLKVIFIIQAISRVLLRPKTGHFPQPFVVVTSRKPLFFPIQFGIKCHVIPGVGLLSTCLMLYSYDSECSALLSPCLILSMSCSFNRNLSKSPPRTF